MSNIDDWAAAAPASGANIDDWAGASTPAAAAAPQSPPTQAPDISGPLGYIKSLGAGLGRGFGSAVLGGEQLVGRGIRAAGDFGQAMTGAPNITQRAGDALINDAAAGIRNTNAEYAPYAAANPTTAATGDMLGKTGAALLLPTSRLPGGALVNGGVAGGMNALTEPVDPDNPDYWMTKLQQGVGGALGGGLVGGLVGGVSRAMAPRLTAAQQDLVNRGINLTPGQLGGPGANTVEQQATSLPFIGNAIAKARNRAIGQFNTAVGNDALAPIGQSVPTNVAPGSATVQHVNDAIGNEFNRIEGQAKFNYDGQFHTDVNGIRQNMLDNGATPQAVQQFDNIFQGQIRNRMDPNTGEMTGQVWGKARDALNRIERDNTIGAPNADQRAIADAVGSLNDVMSANVARNSPTAIQPDLDAASQAYARYKTMERAAGYTGARNSGNVFTPAQYSAAVGARSTAAQKATNSGMGAQLGQNAQSVLGTTVPDSGTAGRGWLTSLLLAPHMLAHPAVAAGALASPLIYSRPGMRAIGAAMTQRPDLVRDLGQKLGLGVLPAASATGAVTGGILGSPDETQ